MRKFGNGTEVATLYDKAGRVTVKMQKSERGELLWGEGYVYGSDGKRTATVDNSGRVTLYEYNRKGQLETVYYPYTKDLSDKLKEEAKENGLNTVTDAGENKYLTSGMKSELVVLMNSMQYGLSYNLTNLHIFIKENYTYDKNGNRKTKTTPYGIVEYNFDKENCLLSSGSRGQSFINYTYDKMGNLLTEESASKTTKYAYNSQNRLIYCEVTDKSKKEYAQTTYSYDAFGRRIIVQDKGEAALRTLYDGLTFDVIKQGPVFESGISTDLNNTGIKYGPTGRPTGDRYRYLSDDDVNDGNRYFFLEEGSYKTTTGRYRGERTTVAVNGTLAAQTSHDYGTEYFTTDLFGSISNVTDSFGTKKTSYSYDAFGSLIQGDLTGTDDFGYLGKQQDLTSKLFNYGYRDYSPQQVRFTTVDPIRDGSNWFAYCNGDPVNFVDLWGLSPIDAYNPEIMNNALAETLTTKFLGVKYDSGGTTLKSVDCSGLLIASLRTMGFNVDRETTGTLSSGRVEWISVLPDIKSEGELGILNFYKMEESKSINHMSIGIGYNNIPDNVKEPMKQLINANEDSSLLVRNDGRKGQYITAKSNAVNQTYAPLSSETPTVKQATINWEILLNNYFDVGLAEDGYWGE